MKLLMISGDRSILQGKKGAFWYTLEEFSKHWERIDIICPQNQIPASRNQHPEFANVFFHPSPWNLFFQQKWIRLKGSELIKMHHHNVMTVHEYPPFYNGIGAARLHRLTGIPYALEIHHIVGFPVASSLTEIIGRIMTRAWIESDARHSAAVRVVNQEVKNVLTDWHVAAEKIHIVPSFYLDSEILRADSSIEKKYDVVTCARLVKNKGLMELLTAVSELPDAKLLIIGDGPMRSKLEQKAASLRIQNRVTFAGWLPSQEDVITSIQSAKIFVMNSKSEGGPRSVLEAMALGMPVISTKVGVMPEVIRDQKNGVFTDGSSKDLAQKMKNLLSSEELRNQLGSEAGKILEKFERKALIKGYAEFLQKLSFDKI